MAAATTASTLSGNHQHLLHHPQASFGGGVIGVGTAAAEYPTQGHNSYYNQQLQRSSGVFQGDTVFGGGGGGAAAGAADSLSSGSSLLNHTTNNNSYSYNNSTEEFSTTNNKTTFSPAKQQQQQFPSRKSSISYHQQPQQFNQNSNTISANSIYSNTIPHPSSSNSSSSYTSAALHQQQLPAMMMKQKTSLAERLNIGDEVRELKLGCTFNSKNTTNAFHTIKCKCEKFIKKLFLL